MINAEFLHRLFPRVTKFPSSTAHRQPSARTAAGGGWGAFEYDAASDAFSPATEANNPPQGHDAKCGFACHTIVQTRDYVFTEYGKR